jgi:hypothetical protein
MVTTITMPTKNGKSIAKLLSVLALAVIMAGTISIAAMAAPHGRDFHGGHDRGWDRHAHDNYRWHHDHPHYVPGYVAAPPVVYAPPQQESGINLILPLNFH